MKNIFLFLEINQPTIIIKKKETFSFKLVRFLACPLVFSVNGQKVFPVFTQEGQRKDGERGGQG